MSEILFILGGAIAGFITGALVYRNNKKQFDEIVDKVEEEVKPAKGKKK